MSNAEDKALEIIESFRDGVLALTLFNDKDVLVKCAIIHVKGIIEELESIFKGKWQSSGIVFWKEVLTELNQM